MQYRMLKVQKQITIRRHWPGLIIEVSFKILEFETLRNAKVGISLIYFTIHA